MVREKTERDYRREAVRPDKGTREALRQKGAKGGSKRTGRAATKGAVKGDSKGKPPGAGERRNETSRPPLTLFSMGRTGHDQSSERLHPREPPYPPPPQPVPSSEEEVEVEVEAVEAAVPEEIPQPCTPPPAVEAIEAADLEHEVKNQPPPPSVPDTAMNVGQAQLVAPLSAEAVSKEHIQSTLPAPVLIYPKQDGNMEELGHLYQQRSSNPDTEATTEASAEWMVRVDGELRPLPSMPEWIKEALAHRPDRDAPPPAFTYPTP
ncbi:hypothetical protein AK812_SmicGene29360 [Symbiodinium microadriaticum]|uniref:Uncharacterized protein n=1 Tax=Symbiodinium microadriaticum TaxID=2951 RepID=A0A1Q9D209_SYMMI|nr:hypothetical protein AK812_SmicGene29360 [Symbiodinium microadriaticum]CAE6955854.1 unnamed protein product [Symbiodinium sp. KB8]CAE7253389.1 unnamed protein product [Symbiodinium microadriaticum]